jgi:hypothetical protein
MHLVIRLIGSIVLLIAFSTLVACESTHASGSGSASGSASGSVSGSGSASGSVSGSTDRR